MKRTNQNAAAAPAPKFDLSIDAKTLSELRELLDQRKKLDDAVNSAPADIVAAEAELAGLRQQFAALEADVVLVDDAKRKRLRPAVRLLGLIECIVVPTKFFSGSQSGRDVGRQTREVEQTTELRGRVQASTGRADVRARRVGIADCPV
ncbi:hypothetical protein [Burkholderia ubonensis]|uniref:hypothetical protein n=1 Tax=Burkholderia ubonensis TaxID=101571 RepID=UPI000AE77562|nr:hypothetical protein [Burkholderia ubonensis]